MKVSSKHANKNQPRVAAAIKNHTISDQSLGSSGDRETGCFSLSLSLSTSLFLSDLLSIGQGMHVRRDIQE
jgi:hypothetical protein